MPDLGRLLILAGLVLILVGILLGYFPNLRLGRLPGDVTIELKNGRIHLPIATSILLSIVLTAVFWILSGRRR